MTNVAMQRRWATGVCLGKVPHNERVIAEFLERQAAERRREVALKEAEEIVRTLVEVPSYEECGVLLRDVRKNNGNRATPSTSEITLVHDFLFETLDSVAFARRQRERKHECTQAITDLFAFWKTEPGDHQQGRCYTKGESAKALGLIMGRNPSANEVDRMWMRKQLEIGEPYRPNRIPIG